MNMAEIWFYLGLILGLILGLAPIILTLRLNLYIKKSLTQERKDFFPLLTVIIPCKGIDPDFEKNISSFLNQQYPDFQLIFVVATEEDPAYLKLSQLLSGLPQVKYKLVVSGISGICCQKNNNLIKGVEEARTNSEIFVFLDSDCWLKPDFLKNLVVPLEDKKIGGTTGYRWYSPVRGGLGSFLRSIWNGGALPLLIDQSYNFTFGGTTAIRREVFEKLDIKSHWQRSAIDDLTLTGALKKAKLSIRFVPECMTATYEDSSLAQTIEFTNRQTIFMRIYHKSFWWMTFVVYALSSLLIVAGVLFLLWPLKLFWAGISCLFIIFWQMLNAALFSFFLTRILPLEAARKLKENRLLYIILTPLATFLILYNSINALFNNTIIWRGITYKIKSPYNIEITKG